MDDIFYECKIKRWELICYCINSIAFEKWKVVDSVAGCKKNTEKRTIGGISCVRERKRGIK